MSRFFPLIIFCICVSVCFVNAQSKILPTTCYQAVKQSNRFGIHQLQSTSGKGPYFAYCDEGATRNWTIVQRRSGNSTSFNRTWSDYKYGFGNLDDDHFIGLEKLHEITQSTLHELWIQLYSWDGKNSWAEYSPFAIGNEHQGYAITILGNYTGNAGDSLRKHAGSKFSTFDRDNDESELENCAKLYDGGWWFKKCLTSNLNGVYHVGGKYKEKFANGIIWQKYLGLWYSYERVQIAIRPVSEKEIP